jgi:hypothetical protein
VNLILVKIHHDSLFMGFPALSITGFRQSLKHTFYEVCAVKQYLRTQSRVSNPVGHNECNPVEAGRVVGGDETPYSEELR